MLCIKTVSQYLYLIYFIWLSVDDTEKIFFNLEADMFLKESWNEGGKNIFKKRHCKNSLWAKIGTKTNICT